MEERVAMASYPWSTLKVAKKHLSMTSLSNDEGSHLPSFFSLEVTLSNFFLSAALLDLFVKSYEQVMKTPTIQLITTQIIPIKEVHAVDS